MATINGNKGRVKIVITLSGILMLAGTIVAGALGYGSLQTEVNVQKQRMTDAERRIVLLEDSVKDNRKAHSDILASVHRTELALVELSTMVKAGFKGK